MRLAEAAIQRFQLKTMPPGIRAFGHRPLLDAAKLGAKG